MRYLALLLIVGLLFSNCGSDDGFTGDDLSQIQQYLEANNLTAESTPSGLHYIIEELGEGDHPTINSTVTIHYKGFLLNGDVFDETNGTPATFPLANLIAGWQEGIPLFKRGGKGLLLLPSSIAYGSRGAGNSIPPNTPIAFEIELVDF